MPTTNYVTTRGKTSVLATNAIIRNTYILLSATLLFSAVIATVAMFANAPPLNPLFWIVGYFGLLFLVQGLRRSAWGLLAIFLFTGFLGYTLGPILNLYLHTYINGGQIVMTALGATGVIFLGLSGYALTTRKDFSYLGGFLFIAILVAFLGGIAAMVFHLPMLSLLVSAAFVLLSSGFILFITSQLIHGGETNYIMATVALYVAIFNLFISLLSLLGAFGGNRN